MQGRNANSGIGQGEGQMHCDERQIALCWPRGFPFQPRARLIALMQCYFRRWLNAWFIPLESALLSSLLDNFENFDVPAPLPLPPPPLHVDTFDQVILERKGHNPQSNFSSLPLGRLQFRFTCSHLYDSSAKMCSISSLAWLVCHAEIHFETTYFSPYC